MLEKKITSWYFNLSFSQKINIISLWATFYILVVLALHVSQMHNIKKDFEEINQENRVVTLFAQDILSRLIELRKIEKEAFFENKLKKEFIENFTKSKISIIDSLEKIKANIKPAYKKDWEVFSSEIKLFISLVSRFLEEKDKTKRQKLIAEHSKMETALFQKLLLSSQKFLSTFHEDTLETVSKSQMSYANSVYGALLLGFIVLVIFIFSIYTTKYDINKKLKYIYKNIKTLNSGNYETDQDKSDEYVVKSKDEFGSIARSLKKALELLALNQKEQELAKKLRGSRLHLAILINDEKSIESLLFKSICFTCRDLGLNRGAIYAKMEDKDALKLCVHFAASKEMLEREEITFKEGVVGQVAFEEKAITQQVNLTNKTTEYIHALPLVYKKRLLGVFYVAGPKEYEKSILEHFDAAAEIISANMHAIIESHKSVKLLEQTQEQARQLEKSHAYKSEFISNMSHELRTPLNAVNTLSFMLKRNKEGNLNAKQLEQASTINKAGNDLLHLINDILDYSKLEAKKMDVHKEKVFVHELMHDLYAYFKHQAEQMSIDFQLEVDKELPKQITTDVQKVEQILKNFLSNALKFTSSKGTVSLKAKLSKADNTCIFSVSDTGVGIPKDKLDEIFEPFIQSRNKNIKGTGLGLSIVSDMARLLQAKVYVQSEYGQGSTFYFQLPISDAKEQTYPPSKESHEAPKKPMPKVLFIGNQLAKITKYIEIAKKEYNLDGMFAIDSKEAKEMEKEHSFLACITIEKLQDEQSLHKYLSQIKKENHA